MKEGTYDCNFKICNSLDIYKEIKEKTSFIHTDNSSVLKTLNFVAENFYENTNPPLTADNIKQKFNLNVKQYNWVVLKALVVQQKWPQIEALLLTKVGELFMFLQCEKF